MPPGKLPEIFISIVEASKLLGCSAETLEMGLRNGTFPIGWAWCTSTENRKGKWNYRIPRQALIAALETGVIGQIAATKIFECRLFSIWLDMKNCCDNHAHPKYSCYGGRGITYYEDWGKYKGFENWAYKSGYREYLILGRHDERFNFTPKNCLWIEFEPRRKLKCI